MGETVGDPGNAVFEMMVFKGTLAEALNDGLEELRKHKINVDKLPLKKVKVRKR